MKSSLLTLITASSLLFSQNAFPIAKHLEINLYNIKPQTLQNERKPKRSQVNYISLETAKYQIEHFGRENSSLRVNGSFLDTYSRKANIEAIIYQNGNLYLNLENNTKKTPSLHLDNVFSNETENLENKFITEITAEDLDNDGFDDIQIDIIEIKEEQNPFYKKIIYLSQGNGKFEKVVLNSQKNKVEK